MSSRIRDVRPPACRFGCHARPACPRVRRLERVRRWCVPHRGDRRTRPACRPRFRRTRRYPRPRPAQLAPAPRPDRPRDVPAASSARVCRSAGPPRGAVAAASRIVPRVRRSPSAPSRRPRRWRKPAPKRDAAASAWDPNRSFVPGREARLRPAQGYGRCTQVATGGGTRFISVVTGVESGLPQRRSPEQLGKRRQARGPCARPGRRFRGGRLGPDRRCGNDPEHEQQRNEEGHRRRDRFHASTLLRFRRRRRLDTRNVDNLLACEKSPFRLVEGGRSNRFRSACPKAVN